MRNPIYNVQKVRQKDGSWKFYLKRKMGAFGKWKVLEWWPSLTKKTPDDIQIEIDLLRENDRQLIRESGGMPPEDIK